MSVTLEWIYLYFQWERGYSNGWVRAAGEGTAGDEAFAGVAANRNLTDKHLQEIDYEKAKIPKSEMETLKKFESYLAQHRNKVLFDLLPSDLQLNIYLLYSWEHPKTGVECWVGGGSCVLIPCCVETAYIIWSEILALSSPEHCAQMILVDRENDRTRTPNKSHCLFPRNN